MASMAAPGRAVIETGGLNVDAVVVGGSLVAAGASKLTGRLWSGAIVVGGARRQTLTTHAFSRHLRRPPPPPPCLLPPRGATRAWARGSRLCGGPDGVGDPELRVHVAHDGTGVFSVQRAGGTLLGAGADGSVGSATTRAAGPGRCCSPRHTRSFN